MPFSENSKRSNQGHPDHIIGTCMDMCPIKERQLREREGLLHKFERMDTIDGCSSSMHKTSIKRYDNNRSRMASLPKADHGKCVKSFARSAAGLDKSVADDLRTVSVLRKTVIYLCTEIVQKKSEPFNFIYDFVFDRLRSVRQDLVIQRIDNEDAIYIIETIIRFHVYAAYRLRNEHISQYDPHINEKHLADCVKRLVQLYEINDYWKSSRDDFECLFCLIHPNCYATLSRAYSLKDKIKSTHFKTTIHLCLAYQNRNYVSFFRLALSLPALLASYCIHHSRRMRSLALQTMCSAYGSKNCKIPITFICTSLAYPRVDQVERTLRQLDVEIGTDSDNCRFAHLEKRTVSVICKKTDMVDDQFCIPDNYDEQWFRCS